MARPSVASRATARATRLLSIAAVAITTAGTVTATGTGTTTATIAAARALVSVTKRSVGPVVAQAAAPTSRATAVP